MKGLRETGFVGTLRFRGMLGTGGFRRLWICFGGCDDAAMVVSNISACTALKNFGPWIDEARKVLDGSPTKDVVLWKPMINGYVQYNHFNEAVALFKEMQTKRVKGDKLTAVALLIGCTQGLVDKGCEFNSMRKIHEIEPKLTVWLPDRPSWS
ncbi:hypothetical protein COP2_033161 [Malus domestica]